MFVTCAINRLTLLLSGVSRSSSNSNRRLPLKDSFRSQSLARFFFSLPVRFEFFSLSNQVDSIKCEKCYFSTHINNKYRWLNTLTSNFAYEASKHPNCKPEPQYCFNVLQSSPRLWPNKSSNNLKRGGPLFSSPDHAQTFVFYRSTGAARTWNQFTLRRNLLQAIKLIELIQWGGCGYCLWSRRLFWEVWATNKTRLHMHCLDFSKLAIDCSPARLAGLRHLAGGKENCQLSRPLPSKNRRIVGFQWNHFDALKWTRSK